MHETDLDHNPGWEGLLRNAFTPDYWLILKLPVAAWFVIELVVPLSWRVLVCAIGLVEAGFTSNSPASEIGNGYFAFYIMEFLLIISVTSGYLAKAFEILSKPGLPRKVIGLGAIVVGPFLGLAAVIVLLFVHGMFHMPDELLYTYLDSWTPFDHWKIVR